MKYCNLFIIFEIPICFIIVTYYKGVRHIQMLVNVYIFLRTNTVNFDAFMIVLCKL